MDEKIQTLKEELSELRPLRSEIQALDSLAKKLDKSFSRLQKQEISAGRKSEKVLSLVSEADEKLLLFHHASEDLQEFIKDLPTFVKKDLRSGLKEHLTILSDHAAKEAKKAFSNEVQALHRAAASAEKAFDRIKNRLGWRGYVIPLSGCVVSFLASCGVAWWMQYGMVKIDSETVRILRNGDYLENAMAGLEESENKKLQTLMKKGWVSYKEKYSL